MHPSTFLSALLFAASALADVPHTHPLFALRILMKRATDASCAAKYGAGALVCGDPNTSDNCYIPPNGETCCDDTKYCPANTYCLNPPAGQQNYCCITGTTADECVAGNGDSSTVVFSFSSAASSVALTSSKSGKSSSVTLVASTSEPVSTKTSTSTSVTLSASVVTSTAAHGTQTTDTASPPPGLTPIFGGSPSSSTPTTTTTPASSATPSSSKSTTASAGAAVQEKMLSGGAVVGGALALALQLL